MTVKTALDYFEAEAAGGSVILTPTATSPVNGVETVNTTPTLVASAFRTTLNAEHADSEFRVASNSNMTSIVVTSPTLGAVESWVVSPALTIGTTYYWDVRYKDVDGTWSSRSVAAEFAIPSSAVQVPTNTSPTNANTNQTDTVTLTADAFASTPSSTHTASQWQISTDNTFASINFDSGIDTSNLTSFTQAGVELNETTYYWRVRYQSDTIGWSGFSSVFSFTTVNESVQKPTNLTPVNSATGVDSVVQLTGDSFTAIPSGNETHAASQWQVGNSDFSTIHFDSGTDAVNLETISATGHPENTTSYWRVRYQGSTTGFSEWSTPFTFASVASYVDWLAYDESSDGVESNLASTGLNNGIDANAIDMVKIDTNKLFCIYADDTGAIQAVVVTTSGLTPTVGTAVQVNASSNTKRIRVIKLDTNKVMVITGRTKEITCVVMTISGTVPTAYTPLVVEVSDSNSNGKFDVASAGVDSAVCMFRDSSSNVSCLAVAVSGNTISIGSAVTVKTMANNFEKCSASEIESGRAVLTWSEDAGDSVYGVLVTVSGTVVTVGSIFGSGDYSLSGTNKLPLVVGTGSGEFCILALDSGDVECVKYSFSGNTATYVSSGNYTAAPVIGAFGSIMSPSAGEILLFTPYPGLDEQKYMIIDVSGTPSFSAVVTDSVAVGAGEGAAVAQIDSGTALKVYDTETTTVKVKVISGA
jgi:hypothetical protein